MSKRIRYEKGVSVLSITQKCNNFCVMCYEPHLLKDNPSFEELKNDILKIKDPSEIYISGGEPTIRPDLFKILLFIRKTYPEAKLNLITNGRLFYYNTFAKKLAQCGLNKIVTELHGSNEMIHDKITQSKSSFNQTVKGIKNILNYQMNMELRIVINKINNDNLLDLAKFIVTNFENINQVIMFPINIIGFAHLNKDSIAVPYTKIKGNVEQALNILSTKFETKLFHYPFCVINKTHWRFVEGVTTDTIRLSFANNCKKCSKKEECPRIWKTYLNIFGDKEFKPL